MLKREPERPEAKVAFLMRIPKALDRRLQEIRWAYRIRSRQELIRQAVEEWVSQRERILRVEAELERQRDWRPGALDVKAAWRAADEA
jgi:hypothetical protein